MKEAQLKENKKSDQQGKNTKNDPSQTQNKSNKESQNKDPKSSKKTATVDEVDNETTPNDSVRGTEREKEYDDTDHEHNYKTPDAEQKNQKSSETKTSGKTTKEQLKNQNYN